MVNTIRTNSTLKALALAILTMVVFLPALLATDSFGMMTIT